MQCSSVRMINSPEDMATPALIASRMPRFLPRCSTFTRGSATGSHQYPSKTQIISISPSAFSNKLSTVFLRSGSLYEGIMTESIHSYYHGEVSIQRELRCGFDGAVAPIAIDRKSTRLNSSHSQISYA